MVLKCIINYKMNTAMIVLPITSLIISQFHCLFVNLFLTAVTFAMDMVGSNAGPVWDKLS